MVEKQSGGGALLIFCDWDEELRPGLQRWFRRFRKEQCCTRLRNSKGFMRRLRLIYAVTSGQGCVSAGFSVEGDAPEAGGGTGGEEGEAQ